MIEKNDFFLPMWWQKMLLLSIQDGQMGFKVQLIVPVETIQGSEQ